MYKTIRTALVGALPAALVERLLDHHRELRSGFLAADWEKVLLKGGKFAEVMMKIVHHERTGNIVADIQVDEEVRKASEASGLRPELRTMIPRHARIMYDQRNKRGGGHDSFDPAEMDAKVTDTVGDWCLAELLRIFGGMDSAVAHSVTRAITQTRLPILEVIDGDTVILRLNGTAREDVGLLLYSRHPSRVSRAEVQSISGHSEGAARIAVSRMKIAKEIHENADGLLLTTLGIAAVEKHLQGKPQVSVSAPQSGVRRRRVPRRSLARQKR